MESTYPLINYDNLTVRIFSELAAHAVENIASSANEMLEVSCLFFDRDVSQKIMEFHKLYLVNAELYTQKDLVDERVEKLISAVQTGDINTFQKNGGESDSPLSGDDTLSHLANIQKDLEALIRHDEKIKERLVPVMQCMQFEDLIVNRIHRLIKCWAVMLQSINNETTVDLKEIVIGFDKHLATAGEYTTFYNCLLGLDYSASDHTSLTMEFADKEPDIKDIHELKERFFQFSQKSLDVCIDQTHEAFQELINLLELVSGDSNEIQYLFSGSEDTLDRIHTLLKNSRDVAGKDTKALLKQIAETREKHNQEAEELLTSFLIALQAQDAIRQNIENIGKFHELWTKFRGNLKESNNFEEEHKREFGEQTLEVLTSEEERSIVRSIIPGLPEIKKNDDEDDFFL